MIDESVLEILDRVSQGVGTDMDRETLESLKDTEFQIYLDAWTNKNSLTKEDSVPYVDADILFVHTDSRDSDSRYLVKEELKSSKSHRTNLNLDSIKSKYKIKKKLMNYYADR